MALLSWLTTQKHTHLEVAAVALSERQDEPLEDQLPNLRELGVDDGDEGGVDVGEDGRRRLGLQNGASQRAPVGRRRSQTKGTMRLEHCSQSPALIHSERPLPAPDDVFLQQLLNDVGNVGHVDFVDETVDGLLQSLPAHSLIGQTAR